MNKQYTTAKPGSPPKASKASSLAQESDLSASEASKAALAASLADRSAQETDLSELDSSSSFLQDLKEKFSALELEELGKKKIDLSAAHAAAVQAAESKVHHFVLAGGPSASKGTKDDDWLLKAMEEVGEGPSIYMS